MQTKTKFAAVLLAFSFFQVALPASAASLLEQKFVISGLMRSKANQETVRLVHGTRTSVSKDDAVRDFSAEIRNQFPEYDLVETLATPLPAGGKVITSKPELWL